MEETPNNDELIKSFKEKYTVMMEKIELRKLYVKQATLMSDHNILITYFSFNTPDGTRFRFYFKDLLSGYIHNPMENKAYFNTDNFVFGLTKTILAAETYIKTNQDG